jgi:hypothetical protein
MGISQDSENTPHQAIQAGMTLLQEALPEWETRVNLKTLNMSQHGHCLLSQLFGSYEEGIRTLHIGPMLIEADLNTVNWDSYGSEYAFTIPSMTPIEAIEETFTQLTNNWKKRIILKTGRFIEVQYETPKGFATPHYNPGEEEELEKKLISLKHRHIRATVINLLTGETVGGTDEGLFDKDTHTRISRWNYWYCPEGIDAREQPVHSHKIVCDLSRA